MAFYPAHCDDNCKGCEKNSCGWCIWKDRATPYYQTVAFKAESSYAFKADSNYEKPYECDNDGYVKH